MKIVRTQERSFIEYVKNYVRSLMKSDQGFSLLELSVAVGVLLVASVTAGTLINSNIQRANKQSALEVAVNEGYTSATKAVMDFDENTTVVSALAEIESKNFDSGQIVLEQVGEATHQDELCIKGTWFDDPSITLTKGACGTYTPPPVVAPPAVNVPVVSSLRYMCDTDVTGDLPILGAATGTNVRLIEVKNGGRASTADYSDSSKRYNATMKAGIEYEVKISGTFAELDAPIGATKFNDCLIGVKKLDDKSGVTKFGFIGGKKFVDVPETIPSTVTSLRYAFQNAPAFNDEDVSKWDVSNVTDFLGTFYRARTFNQSLDSWNMGSAATIRSMFSGAVKFNNGMEEGKGLSSPAGMGKWNLANVADMQSAFKDATSFNQNLNGWTFSKAATLQSMFENATSFNSGREPGVYYNQLNWNRKLGTVKNFANMFKGATSYNQAVIYWNTESATNMAGMFQNAESFNVAINTNSSYGTAWDVSNVTDMSNMFNGAVMFNRDLSTWNTGNVTNMSNMFSGAMVFNNGDTGNSAKKPLAWDTSNVTNMSNMFRITPVFNQYIGKWDTGKVTNMYSMFYGSTLFNNGDVENNTAKALEWNTKQVTDMSWMFAAYNEGAKDDLAFYNSFNQDISKWSTSNVKDMSYMFNSATLFNQTISTRTISGERYWDTSQVTNMRGMFRNAESFNIDIKNWNVAKVTDMSQMFESAEVFNKTLANWNPISVTTMEKMFQDSPAFNNGMGHGVAGNTLTWSDKIKNVENTSYMFNRARAFNQKVDTWNTSSVTNMKAMFKDTDSFNGSMNSGGTNKWNVSNVTDMSEMFSGAKAFNQPLTEWNTSSVTNMDEMFLNTVAFKQNTSHLNVSKVVSHSRYAEGSKMIAEPVWVS